MFGMSAAYIETVKGVTDPDMRKMIRYCVTDAYVSLSVYNRLKKRFK